MDFFTHQDQARRRSRVLSVVFGVAVVVVAAAATAVILGAIAAVVAALADPEPPGARRPHWTAPVLSPPVVLISSGSILALILGGTLFRLWELRSGGASVALSLGGRRVAPNTIDPTERRLLNIVEEMALAAGVPTPAVYLLDNETAINAFAAGHEPSDAVIGVTRGCLLTLNREQLQGVIAHEFSHILNGDMRLNLRMVGLLFGILMISVAGRIVLEAGLRAGQAGRGRNAGAVLLALVGGGIALIVVGSIGVLVGTIIKAAFGRQREYLADAAAVQFTRNPGGIAGALRVLGGSARRGRLINPHTAEMSHMLFAGSVTGWLDRVMATHPPLEDRIRRVMPDWDGTMLFAPTPAARADRPVPIRPITVPLAAAAAALGPTQPIDDGLAAASDISAAHLRHAEDLLGSLPPALLTAARTPYDARAVLLALLLDDRPGVQAGQFAALEHLVSPDTVATVRRLWPMIARAGRAARLPLAAIALPALRALSPDQYRAFRGVAEALIDADQRVSMFEWSLERLVLRHADRHFGGRRPLGTQYYALNKLGGPIAVLLSAVAHAGSEDASAAAETFARAAAATGMPGGMTLLGTDDCGPSALGPAIDTLETVSPARKRQLLHAVAAAAGLDRRVSDREAELLRVVSDNLGVPLGRAR
ncbi:MAG: M48 family metallopeptidase [Phycisphaerales bacterium]|nr:M48 family metallopeptidase [Phycisphaerales bacterium]